MSFISKAALALALTAGAAVIATPPALAQKNKKQEQPAVKVSEQFRTAAIAAENALKANDMAAAGAALQQVNALAQSEDEKFFAASLTLPYAARQNDRAAMAQALDVLIASPKTPPNQLPQYNFLRGSIAVDNKKFAEAVPYLNRARELGYQDENLPLLIARTQFESGNVRGGVAELEKAIAARKAAGQKAPEDWYNYAIAKLYGAGQRAETAKWLREAVIAYPTATNWRKALVVYRDSVDKSGAALDKGQRLDLFRLMRATKSLADQNDYLEYADLAFQMGLPFETKAVIEEGRAAGKIPASNATFNKLYADAQSAIKAEGSLAALEKRATSGTAAAQLADAYLGSGNYAKAAELYRQALQKGGVKTDEVNTRLGIALAHQGQKAEAKQQFAAVTTAPRSDIANFWSLYMDTSSTGTATASAR